MPENLRGGYFFLTHPVQCTWKSNIAVERKTVPRDESADMAGEDLLCIVGALPMESDGPAFLSYMCASTGSQRSSIVAAAIWPREHRPHTSLTQHWRRAVVVQWLHRAIWQAVFDICLCVCMSLYVSVLLSVFLCFCVYLSVSIRLSVCLSVSLFCLCK